MSESKQSGGKAGILALLFVLVLAVLFLPISILMVLGGSRSQAAAADCKPVTISASATASSGSSLSASFSLEVASTPAVNVPAEYVEPIRKAAEVSGLPESIVAKQIQAESNFDRFAGSLAGAKGPAQFIDSTWAVYGNGGDVYNIEDALDAYGRYMRDLADQVAQYAGEDADLHVQLTLAAYNAGPGAVAQFQGIPPYPETINYIEKITSGAQVQFSTACQQVTGGRAWDGDLGDGEWTNPCPGCVFTSPYGWRSVFPPGDWRNEHVGVDLATPGAGHSPGTLIIAPTDMTVVGFLEADGCVTTLQDEAPGFGFNFCHLDSWEVSQGQKLKRGDVIGVEGGTGMGSKLYYATHLHLEIYAPDSPVPGIPYNGHNLDPEPILKEKGAWVTP